MGTFRANNSIDRSPGHVSLKREAEPMEKEKEKEKEPKLEAYESRSWQQRGGERERAEQAKEPKIE